MYARLSSKQSPIFECVHKPHMRAHMQTHASAARCCCCSLLLLLQRLGCCLVALHCSNRLHSFLLRAHPQTISGSQWTTSAREIPTKRSRDIERQREREREEMGEGREEDTGREEDDGEVGRERGTKEDRGRFE